MLIESLQQTIRDSGNENDRNKKKRLLPFFGTYRSFCGSSLSSFASELTLPAQVSRTLQSLLLDSISWS